MIPFKPSRAGASLPKIYIQLPAGRFVVSDNIYLPDNVVLLGRRENIVGRALRAFANHVLHLVLVHILKKNPFARSAPEREVSARRDHGVPVKLQHGLFSGVRRWDHDHINLRHDSIPQAVSDEHLPSATGAQAAERPRKEQP
ncbi:hypothetical protein WG907_04275 [Sphingobium sp. AN558]|uniref:hypothetical protein n=1 Tax=Sphingobium sp. AN558 TaxID=3133442 RepID=UPI0030BCE086